MPLFVYRVLLKVAEQGDLDHWVQVLTAETIGNCSSFRTPEAGILQGWQTGAYKLQ